MSIHGYWSACSRLYLAQRPLRRNPLTTRIATRGRRSVEAVIASQAHEVASKVLAQGENLRLVATAELEHHAVVRGRRGSHQHAFAQAYEPSGPLGTERLDGPVEAACQRTAPKCDSLGEVVQSRRAHGHRRIGLLGMDLGAVVHFEEAQDRADGRLVVGAEVVVDDHEQLLGGEQLLV